MFCFRIYRLLATALEPSYAGRSPNKVIIIWSTFTNPLRVKKRDKTGCGRGETIRGKLVSSYDIDKTRMSESVK